MNPFSLLGYVIIMKNYTHIDTLKYDQKAQEPTNH